MDNTSRTDTENDQNPAAELEAIRSQLRDYEKALVERIADVDDDRRGTANKLQRAWATHSEEVDARLRRQGAFLLTGVTLFVILAAVVLFLVYRQMDAARRPLAEGLTEVKKEVAMISGVAAQDDVVRQQIAQLSAAVDGISSSLERLDAGPRADPKSAPEEERAVRDQAVVRLSDEIRDLKRRQAELTEEVRSLGAALAAATKETAAALAVARKGSAGALAAASAATEAATSFGKALGEHTKPLAGAEPAAATASERAPATPPESQAAAPYPPATEGGQGETADPETAPPAPAPARPEQHEISPVGASEAPAGPAPAIPKELPAGEIRVTGNDSYALQLIGFYSFDDLAAYAARSDLPDRVYYREETYQGRPWFVLIHSLHPSAADATAERSRLPPRLAALDIWVRPLRDGTSLKILERR